ncbi:hypothetical protein FisN_6Lh179 [Fistulifera solaris]|uniref:OTU domain-containing protein n=1 Tax=Fistulifera solaris TaxID=1519565 RepID=A0A1Z5J618_FISSO|nr:hypothetical protein FisN_6Lh179 [Fistulifera solaris]|eukprot:GAX09445.1 hypothetical protein FisN_6Lh179 [Fistulifera solaris]
MIRNRNNSWIQNALTWLRLLFVLLVPEVVNCFRPYSSYRFAPNGVCISPKHFVDVNDSANTFVMRSVPGEGDCMFLAVALATLTSMGLGGNDTLLRAISRETRDVVATVLELPSGHLVIEGKRLVTTQALLRSAAKGEGLSTEEYLTQLRKEGIEGGLYGGGPELTVLANVLRRPISIYEIDSDGIQQAGEQGKEKDVAFVRRMGVFGKNVFQDPLEALPESAILSHPWVTNGAYSWHLHILVVDTSRGEKHACVLLPQKL